VVLGERRARHLLAAVSLALGCAFALIAGQVGPTLTTIGAVALAGSISLSAVLLLPAGCRGGRRDRRRPYRVFMATQYVVHLTVLVYIGPWPAISLA
jgi:hypothetical protein